MEQFGNLDSNTKHYPIKKLSEIADYWNGLTYKPINDVLSDYIEPIVLEKEETK